MATGAETIERSETTEGPVTHVHVHNHNVIGEERKTWKKRARLVAAAGAVALAGAIGFNMCEGTNFVQRTASVPQARVFAARGLHVGLFAETGAHEIAKASVAIKPPGTGVWGINVVMGAISRTSRNTSIFTGQNGRGPGEIDCFVGLKDGPETVKRGQNGHEVHYVPASRVVQLCAPNEKYSMVVRDDGDSAVVGQGFSSIIGGKAKGQKALIANARARLDSDARKVAIYEAETQCQSAAWKKGVTQLAMQDGFRQAAAWSYHNAVAEGAKTHVTYEPFNASKIDLVVVGAPHFSAPRPTEHHVSISDGNGGKPICDVAATAYEPAPADTFLTNADGIPFSLTDINLSQPMPLPENHHFAVR